MQEPKPNKEIESPKLDVITNNPHKRTSKMNEKNETFQVAVSLFFVVGIASIIIMLTILCGQVLFPIEPEPSLKEIVEVTVKTMLTKEAPTILSVEKAPEAVPPHQHQLPPSLVVVEATTSTLFLRALGSQVPFFWFPRDNPTTRTAAAKEQSPMGKNCCACKRHQGTIDIPLHGGCLRKVNYCLVCGEIFNPWTNPEDLQEPKTEPSDAELPEETKEEKEKSNAEDKIGTCKGSLENREESM